MWLQTPFTTLGFGLGTNIFEREIQKAILKVRIGGLGVSKRTAIFPKLIFGIKKGINFSPEDPNYDIKQLALECSIKRMYPDIVNYDKLVEVTGSYKAPMGCRSFLHSWKDENGEEVSSGRNNLGVVSLNLPRQALKSKTIEEFYQNLDEVMSIAKDALVYRMNRTFEASPDMAPIMFKNGALGHRLSSEDEVKQIYLNDRATISLGYIGLYEVAARFYGEDWEDNQEAKDFTLDILQKMKAATDEWSKETGVHFSIYSTPAESLTDRFCKIDTKDFGEVKGITDKGYYTNSFHYDVRKEVDPFSKILFEADYPKYASGGFIHYVEYPKLEHNKEALEQVWDFSYDHVAYLGTNTPIDKCYECGLEIEFIPTPDGYECPGCGNNNPDKCDVVKRQCGYLGQPQARPNAEGRKKEIDARVKHL